MPNITFQIYPKTDLEITLDNIERSVEKVLESYIGHGNVRVQQEDDMMHVYLRPIVPLKHIHVNVVVNM